MPPRVNSRYAFCDAVPDEDGIYFLTDREPFLWDSTLEGTREYIVGTGDTLAGIAYKSFQGIRNSEHLWWVILDFQPGSTILDPTQDLRIGLRLKIPATRIVRERILGG